MKEYLKGKKARLNENNTNILTNIIENRKKINEIIDKINGGTNGE